ncbi:MAG TPA: metallophosphoesterase [Syntrophomonadaceae bacterium]|nr:metallophosphoesterase [Syntrophomonadaceae bacterium]
MNSKFAVFLGVFIFIYGLINYYIGLRGWQFVNGLFSNPGMLWGWIIVMAFLAVSYPLGRILAHLMPGDSGKILIVLGSYWLAYMYYLLIILLALDIIRLINRWVHIVPQATGNYPVVTGLLVIIAVTVIVFYGAWNANHPVIKNYEVTLDKKSGSVDTLQAAVVSDIHLGWINGTKQIELMTEIINSLNPDIVLIPGDVIDEGIDLSTEQKIPDILRNLHPALGTYAIMGNHEYISGNADKAEAYLEKGGVTVLRDEWVKCHGFYLVGRDDKARAYYYGSPRKNLDAVMKGIEKDKLPVILMDHQPSDLQEAEKAGVSLELSGHTHRGQLWPNNYITRAIFEQDWGYMRKNNLQVIVSCGYGTWGPPIRIGNKPEILNIQIRFRPVDLQTP